MTDHDGTGLDWFAGGVVAAVISALVAIRQSRMDERLARLNHELDAEVHRRTATIDRDLRAEEVLTRYREPLAAAAFDFQSRLYSILRLDFLQRFGDGHPQGEEALRTTLFRLAQYFGWTEILRRDIQFLSFPEADETRRVAHRQSQISQCLLTHSYGPALMIWSDVQRAIGERMIVEEHGNVLCMGYATFATAATQRLRRGTTVSGTSFTRRPREIVCAMHSTCFASLSKRWTQTVFAIRTT